MNHGTDGLFRRSVRLLATEMLLSVRESWWFWAGQLSERWENINQNIQIIPSQTPMNRTAPMQVGWVILEGDLDRIRYCVLEQDEQDSGVEAYYDAHSVYRACSYCLVCFVCGLIAS